VRWVNARVRLALLMNDVKSALQLLTDAIGQRPAEVNFWKERANIKFDQGDVLGFEQDIRHAMTLNADDPDVLNALGYYLADSRKNLVEARTLLVKANALLPNKHYITDSLGWLAFREGDLSQAEQLLAKAYQLQSDAEVLRHWLSVLLAQGQTEGAKQLAQKEGARFPDDADLQKMLQELHK
jgi:Flp pilus assembly protein TadD